MIINQFEQIKNKTMKTLIKYSDWLLKTRGKIEPKVGDKYFTFKNGKREVNSSLIHCANKIGNDKYWNDCYVEIELPEIEWIACENLKNMVIGKLHGFELVKIYSRNINKCEMWLHKYSVPVSNPPDFEGSLEECKTYVNKLLWKI